MMPEEKVESNIDVVGTIKKFVEAEEPELEQKEAIMKYEEHKRKRRRKKHSGDEDIEDNTEEKEHLNRIKQELLASLRRVEEMEKEVFNEKDVEMKSKIKVNKKNSGGKSNQQIKEQQTVRKIEYKQKERE